MKLRTRAADVRRRKTAQPRKPTSTPAPNTSPRERDQRTAELARRPGATAASIAEQLRAEGFTASRSAIGRALVRLRGPQRVGRRRAAPFSAALPSADEIAASTDLKTIEGWIDLTGAIARDAHARGDNAMLARASMIGISAIEARRKAEHAEDHRDGVWVSSAEMEVAAVALESNMEKVAEAVAEQIAKGAESNPSAPAIELVVFNAVRRVIALLQIADSSAVAASDAPIVASAAPHDPAE
jgi:hypothetical protein